MSTILDNCNTCASLVLMRDSLHSGLINVSDPMGKVRFIHEGKKIELSVLDAAILGVEISSKYEKIAKVAIKKSAENAKKRKAETCPEEEPVAKKAKKADKPKKVAKEHNKTNAGEYFPDLLACHFPFCKLNDIVVSNVTSDVYAAANEELAKAEFNTASTTGLLGVFKAANACYIGWTLVKVKQRNAKTNEVVYTSRIVTTGYKAAKMPTEGEDWEWVKVKKLANKSFESFNQLCSSERVLELAQANPSGHNPNGWENNFVAQTITKTWPVGFFQEGKQHQWTLPRGIPFTKLREIILQVNGLPAVSYKKRDGTVVNLPADMPNTIGLKRRTLNEKLNGSEVQEPIPEPEVEQNYYEQRSVPTTPNVPALETMLLEAEDIEKNESENDECSEDQDYSENAQSDE